LSLADLSYAVVAVYQAGERARFPGLNLIAGQETIAAVEAEFARAGAAIPSLLGLLLNV